jgi:hypothetical protein
LCSLAILIILVKSGFNRGSPIQASITSVASGKRFTI